MRKVWGKDAFFAPVDNNVNAGDLQILLQGEAEESDDLLRVSVRQDDVWVLSLRIDADARIAHDSLPENLATLGDDGKLDAAALPDDLARLNDKGKLPDEALSAAVPLKDVDGKIQIDDIPVRLVPPFDPFTNKVTGSNTRNATTQLVDADQLAAFVTVGKYFRFHAFVRFSADAKAGARFTVNGPKAVAVTYTSRWPSSRTGEVIWNGDDYNQPDTVAPNTGALSVVSNIATIDGVLLPMDDGLLQVRFASDGRGAITILDGSYIKTESYFAAI